MLLLDITGTRRPGRQAIEWTAHAWTNRMVVSLRRRARRIRTGLDLRLSSRLVRLRRTRRSRIKLWAWKRPSLLRCRPLRAAAVRVVRHSKQARELRIRNKTRSWISTSTIVRIKSVPILLRQIRFCRVLQRQVTWTRSALAFNARLKSRF